MSQREIAFLISPTKSAEPEGGAAKSTRGYLAEFPEAAACSFVRGAIPRDLSLSCEASVLVCPTTFASGCLRFHSRPRYEPRTPGPTMRRSSPEGLAGMVDDDSVAEAEAAMEALDFSPAASEEGGGTGEGIGARASPLESEEEARLGRPGESELR